MAKIHFINILLTEVSVQKTRGLCVYSRQEQAHTEGGIYITQTLHSLTSPLSLVSQEHLSVDTENEEAVHHGTVIKNSTSGLLISHTGSWQFY